MTELETRLKASAGFTDVMGAGAACRLFAGVAKEGTAIPFAAYRVDESDSVTKDGAGVYDITVALIFMPDEYKTCIAMKNVVKEALFAPGSHFSYQDTSTVYDEEMDKYVSVIGFTATMSTI